MAVQSFYHRRRMADLHKTFLQTQLKFLVLKKEYLIFNISTIFKNINIVFSEEICTTTSR